MSNLDDKGHPDIQHFTIKLTPEMGAQIEAIVAETGMPPEIAAIIVLQRASMDGYVVNLNDQGRNGFAGTFQRRSPGVIDAEGVEDRSLDRVGTSESLCKSLCTGIRLRFGATMIFTKLFGIGACPSVVDRFKPAYVSLDGSETLTVSELMMSFDRMGPSLGSLIDTFNKRIRNGRRSDPKFLLEDSDMEILRRLLFLANTIGVKEIHLCDFGAEALRDLRIFVREWEESKVR